MIQLTRNTHHANGENIYVLEVWKFSGPAPDDFTGELIVVIPLDSEDEKVQVEVA